MLSLEKKEEGNISIALKEKENWITFSLLKAFFIAFLLHLSAIFLFQIQPLLPLQSYFLHQPTNAAASLTNQDEGEILAWLGDEVSTIEQLIPPLTHFKISFSPHLLRENPKFLQELSLPNSFFQNRYLPLKKTLQQSSATAIFRKPTIRFSGEIQDFEVEIDLSLLYPSDKLHYRVYIDARNSTILWIEPLYSSEKQRSHRQVVDLLFHAPLKNKKTKKEGIFVGEIEVG